jgi:hypothetical protein
MVKSNLRNSRLLPWLEAIEENSGIFFTMVRSKPKKIQDFFTMVRSN